MTWNLFFFCAVIYSDKNIGEIHILCCKVFAPFSWHFECLFAAKILLMSHQFSRRCVTTPHDSREQEGYVFIFWSLNFNTQDHGQDEPDTFTSWWHQFEVLKNAYLLSEQCGVTLFGPEYIDNVIDMSQCYFLRNEDRENWLYICIIEYVVLLCQLFSLKLSEMSSPFWLRFKINFGWAPLRYCHSYLFLSV